MTHDSQSVLLKWALGLASIRLGDRRDEVLDDLVTWHAEWSRRGSRLRADLRVFRAAADILIRGIGEPQPRPYKTHSFHMLRNYLQLAARGIKRRPGYTGITVFGLAVGLSCCLLILSYARHHLTYDDFHDDAESVYRVNIHALTPEGDREIKAGQPIPLADAIKASFDEVFVAAPVILEEAVLLEAESKTFEEDVLHTTDSFFDVFTFPFVHGDPEAALREPGSIVLTVSAAQRLFGVDDVVGRAVGIVEGGITSDLAVSGVIEDPPGNSSVRFSALRPLSEWRSYDSLVDSWTSWVTNTYVRLGDRDQASGVRSRLNAFTAERYSQMIQTWVILKWLSGDEGAFRLALQPMSEVHFSPEVQQSYFAATSPRFPLFLIGLAAAILLIACINFTTLAVGRASRRALEVGMRKALGARRSQIVSQFWSEAILLSGIALLVGVLIAWLLLPVFSSLTDSRLSLPMDLRTALLLPGLVLLTGLLAGAYPAIYLSRFKPEQALRSRASSRGPNRWMQALVVLQFMLSIGFIISVLAVSAQLRHLQRMDLGFDRDQLLVVETHSTDVEESDRLVRQLREEWKALAGVGTIAASSSGLNRDLRWASFGSRDGEAHTYYVNRVDREFLETMGLEVVAGQGFSAAFPTDPDGVLLVNEALVRDFEWDDPIGEEVHNDGRVAGVVADYYFKSLQMQVEPMALRLSSIGDDPFRYLYVRLEPGDVQETLAGLEAAWRRVAPDRPFSRYFLDDDLEQQYASEARVRRLIATAGVLAVVIACLGLFGLSAYAAERRTKEIGIRKAIGAGVPSIVLMLMKEFVGLVLIAAVMASPIAWILISRWLEQFAQRIELSLWMPGLAALLAIAIAVLTVSYHAMRAALADPVRSLRLE